MNISEQNFFWWLTEQRLSPEKIEYTDKKDTTFVTPENEYIVKKLYGDKIILRSTREEKAIRNENESRKLVIMPESPKEDSNPVSIVPVSEIDVDNDIPQNIVGIFSTDNGEVPRSDIQIAKTYTYQRVSMKLPDNIIDKVDKRVRRSDKFDSRQEFLQNAVREKVETSEEFSPAQ